jgi:hypothetical protein
MLLNGLFLYFEEDRYNIGSSAIFEEIQSLRGDEQACHVADCIDWITVRYG